MLVFQIGDLRHVDVVGCGMWKPVVVIVESELRLTASIGMHPVDVHPAGSVAVEINPFAVVTIFRSVVEAFGIGQPDFVVVVDIVFINIPLAVAHGAVSYPLIVRAHAVPITWPC